jgi:hypothetical protein
MNGCDLRIVAAIQCPTYGLEKPERLKRSSWSHPLRRLARNRRDAIEVFVVVPYAEPRQLGRRPDQQISDLHTSVMQATDVCELTLHIERTIEGSVCRCHLSKPIEFVGQPDVVGGGTRRVEHFEANLRTEYEAVGIEVRDPRRLNGWVQGAMPNTRVNE